VNGPKSLVVSIAVAATATSFLIAFYRLVKVRWPLSYVQARRSRLEGDVIRSPARFLLFRFAPVYAVHLFAVVSTVRLHGQPRVAIVAAAGSYWVLSTGRVFTEDVLSRYRRDQPVAAGRFLFHAVMTVALTFVVWIAWETRAFFAGLIPPIAELVNGFWTGLFTAILAAAALSFTRRETDTAKLVTQSQREVGGELIASAQRIGRRSGVDGQLLLSIMLAENLQRPRWFRIAERALGSIRRTGTYGVMQVPSSSRVSDSDSIEYVANKLKPFGRPPISGYSDSQIQALAEEHNPDRAFSGLVKDIYRSYDGVEYGVSALTGIDGRPALRVRSMTRWRKIIDVRGDCVHEVGQLRCKDDAGQDVTVRRDPWAVRDTWRIEVSVFTDSFTIGPTVGNGDFIPNQLVTIREFYI